jgi:type IV secretory pathway TrbD component
VGLAVLTGLAAGALGFNSSNPEAGLGVLLAILVYIASVMLARGVAAEVEPRLKNRVYITGLGSYIMIFLFTWILYNTLIFIA